MKIYYLFETKLKMEELVPRSNMYGQ